MMKKNCPDKMKVGKKFYCGGYIEPHNPGTVEIGDHVVLGQDSRILTHGPIRPYKENNKIIIEDLVWTGAACIILPGVKIGKLALIGAGSVVTRDVPRYGIVAGNPVRFIRYRDCVEIFRYYTIRVIMNKILGTVEPNYDLLTMNDVAYMFDLPRKPKDANDPIHPLRNIKFENLTMETIRKIFNIE